MEKKDDDRNPGEFAQKAPKGTGARGPIMAIGGAETRSTRGEILQQFFEMAGGPEARVVTIPTASEDPGAGEDYVRIFASMGVQSSTLCPIRSREDANSDRCAAPILDATGIFLSGGDQNRLTQLLVGTLAADCIRRRSAQGATVAGTSAGASILSANVMSSGDGEAAPRKGMTEMVAGLALTNDVIIDQHFNARGRIGRLLVIFSMSPGLIALGVDENTAAVITDKGLVTAIGENSVFVLDGRSVYSDVFDREEGEVITLTGCTLHTLGRGRSFDLNGRCVVGIVEEQTGSTADES
ncbi:MAG: cyanophycinase [Thermomicrobiales bacterium]